MWMHAETSADVKSVITEMDIHGVTYGALNKRSTESGPVRCRFKHGVTVISIFPVYKLCIYTPDPVISVFNKLERSTVKKYQNISV
jgi:hypothetical protein